MQDTTAVMQSTICRISGRYCWIKCPMFFNTTSRPLKRLCWRPRGRTLAKSNSDILWRTAVWQGPVIGKRIENYLGRHHEDTHYQKYFLQWKIVEFSPKLQTLTVIFLIKYSSVSFSDIQMYPTATESEHFTSSLHCHDTQASLWCQPPPTPGLLQLTCTAVQVVQFFWP